MENKKPAFNKSRVKVNTLKLDSKSFYFVTRLLPNVKTVLQVKSDLQKLEKALFLLSSIDRDYVALNIDDLEKDRNELICYINGFKHLLREEVEVLNLNIFTEYELRFINNLIDN